MNKGVKTLIGVALIGGAYMLYRNFTTFAATYTARVGTIKFNAKETQRSLFLRAIFDVNILLTNPSKFTGLIRGLKLNVINNGKLVATVNQSIQVNIPAQNSVAIPVQIGLNTLGLFGNIQSAIIALQSGQPITLEIVGSILTSYGEVPVKNTINVP